MRIDQSFSAQPAGSAGFQRLGHVNGQALTVAGVAPKGFRAQRWAGC